MLGQATVGAEPGSDGVGVPEEASQLRELVAASASAGALQSLCVIARLHHIAAEPAHVAHQLGWPPSHHPSTEDLLLAAKHLALKAKLSRSPIDRLNLAPLPALALMSDGRCQRDRQFAQQRTYRQCGCEYVERWCWR